MIRDYIKKEINAAPFVAVEVDATTDVTKLRSLSFCVMWLKARWFGKLRVLGM